jgi:hypothetical protein
MDEPDTNIARGPRRQVLIAVLVTAILGITLGTGYALNVRADNEEPAGATPNQGATEEEPPADEPTDEPTDDPTDEPTEKVEPPAEDPTDEPSDQDSEPAEEAVKRTLSDDYLLTADRIPAVPTLAAWKRVAPQDVPTLSCQGDWLSSLDPEEVVSAEFRAPLAGTEDSGLSGLVNVAVLEFGGIEVAGAAYQSMREWLETCPATHSELGSAPPSIVEPVAQIMLSNGPDIADAHEAHQVVIDVCLDGCDGSLTEYETIAHLGNRVVLVSYAEGSWVAGTMESDQVARAQKATERAIAHGMWDFH